MNPKALSLGELYGEYDLSSNEWTDGILSSVMRTACAGIQRIVGCGEQTPESPKEAGSLGIGISKLVEKCLENGEVQGCVGLHLQGV